MARLERAARVEMARLERAARVEMAWNCVGSSRVLGAANALHTKEGMMHRSASPRLVAVSCTMGLGLGSTGSAQTAPKSLYDRLGGVYNIATVVDDFIERLLVNATLNANPAITEARARVPKAGLKFH